MTGTDFLADTNAMLYLLNGNECMRPFISKQLGYSIITEMELLSYPDISEKEVNCIREMLSICTEFVLDSDVKTKTIDLRRKYKIKLPDAIVAATAISNNLPLITADKGFHKIDELNLVLIEPVGLVE